ncbi:helix-turn-helix domain-containing protein [Halocalculus aciditolerans]|uniref:Helix-turn-helix domain-containing protein n=1 Tax=Halocalculus aciditolerans TaxID=1383812 RepID=A0A830FCG8_9EURY|nr:helix-turn-helix domain-containing protein [Halocalculus aciditolerans]GGL61220.1 helix-turn-helix domain-containing protein [Halocalculus aciditolerans]
MREVTLRIRHQGQPESEVSRAHPDVTLRSVSSLTGSAAERKRIVELTGPAGEVAAFLDEFGNAEPVLDVEPFSPLTNDRVFAGVTIDFYRWDSIAQRLTDLGVHYRMGTTIKDGWEHWTLYLDDDDSLSDIVGSIEDAGNTAELLRDVSLEEVEGREHLALSRMLDDLTDRQREVLSVAIDLGYYEPGADVAVKDIGDAVGIAPTTAWEHLVRAEGKVMDEVGEHITSHGM